jgi:hypothetical protein
MFVGRRRRGNRWIWWAVGGAAVAVVAILALVLFAQQVAPPQGTVLGAQLTITGQGDTFSGIPWFGPSEVNYTGPTNGYPFTYEAGSTFNFSVQLTNIDSRDHNISAVAIRSPFSIVSTNPRLPYSVDARDDFLLQIEIQSPARPVSAMLELTLTTFG